MARPSHRPRLSAIDGQALGDEAQRHAEDYMHSLAMRLGLSLRVEEQRVPQLAFALRALTGYAQGHHALDAPVSEYLQSIAEPLWIRPLDGGGYQTPELDQALGGDLDRLSDDWRGQVIVVMVAALARERLEAGRDLTVAQLAALASYSPDHVRLMAREGRVRLHEEDGELRCSAEEARRVIGRGAA